MVYLEIVRCDVNPERDYIFGDARLFDENHVQIYKFVSLERYSKRIPIGDYKVDITFSQKFHKDMLHVCNVSNRSGIRIHAFNFAYQSLGCIALGSYRRDSMLCLSQRCIDKVFNYIKDNGGVCSLSII